MRCKALCRDMTTLLSAYQPARQPGGDVLCLIKEEWHVAQVRRIMVNVATCKLPYGAESNLEFSQAKVT